MTEEAALAITLADACLARDQARDELVAAASKPSTSTRPLPAAEARTQEDLVRALSRAECKVIRATVRWKRFRDGQ